MTLISCGGGGSSVEENPLLQRSWDTPFGVVPFESVRAEHYIKAFDLAFDERRRDIERIVSDPKTTFESVILALDCSGGRLRELRDLFEMSEAAISDESYRAVSDRLAPLIAESDDLVWMNQELYLKVRALYLQREELDLDPQQLRL